MPNCLAIYLILATYYLGFAIIVEASLSFPWRRGSPGCPQLGGHADGGGSGARDKGTVGGEISRTGHIHRRAWIQLARRCTAGCAGAQATGNECDSEASAPRMKGLHDECALARRTQHMRASWCDNARSELLRRPCQCGYTRDDASNSQAPMEQVLVKGSVRTRLDAKRVSFLELNDGST